MNRVAVSIGCPSGIGPEVAVAAAVRAREACAVLVGDEGVVRRAARLVGVADRRLVRVDDPALFRGESGRVAIFQPGGALGARAAPFGRPTAEGGAAQLAWIDAATRLVTSGAADALVTAPVSKHAIASSGGTAAARRFLGHTEHLARELGAKEVVMAFWSEELTIALATTHLALAGVPRAVTKVAVAAASFHVARLAARLGTRRPRVAVCALNPHAGEGGLLGREESMRILPGVVLARGRLARAGVRATIDGPMGAESAIRLAREGSFDAVVAMYHDQATIPMKLLGFGDAVNVTLGLPIVRTSVDHGTAYDRAGTATADPRGMRAAIALAARLID